MKNQIPLILAQGLVFLLLGFQGEAQRDRITFPNSDNIRLNRSFVEMHEVAPRELPPTGNFKFDYRCTFNGKPVPANQSTFVGALTSKNSTFRIAIATTDSNFVRAEDLVIELGWEDRYKNRFGLWYMAENDGWKMGGPDLPVQITYQSSRGKTNDPFDEEKVHYFFGRFKNGDPDIKSLKVTAYLVNTDSSKLYINQRMTNISEKGDRLFEYAKIENVPDHPGYNVAPNPNRHALPIFEYDSTNCTRIELLPANDDIRSTNYLYRDEARRIFQAGNVNHNIVTGQINFYLGNAFKRSGWNELFLLRRIGDFQMDF